MLPIPEYNKTWVYNELVDLTQKEHKGEAKLCIICGCPFISYEDETKCIVCGETRRTVGYLRKEYADIYYGRNKTFKKGA